MSAEHSDDDPEHHTGTMVTAPLPQQLLDEDWRAAAGGDACAAASCAVMRVFEITSYAILVADTSPRIVAVNPAFIRITGWAADEVVGRNPSVLSSGRQDAKFYCGLWRALRAEGHWEGEIWNRRKNGQIYPEWLTIDATRDADGRISSYIGVFADITERKRDQDNLERLAFHDALTGLPNRRLFNDRLDNALERAKRESRRAAVVAIDLDGSKAVNDRHGHAVGDDLLIGVADRLSGSLRASDTLARAGGDEFLALIPTIEFDDDAAIVARKMLDTASRPFDVARVRVTVGASLGISIYPVHGDTPATLYEAADRAMYQAKRSGKGAIRMSAPVT